MRSPHGISPPSGMRGLEQRTIIDRIKTQGTIFDELHSKFNPEKKILTQGPLEYQEPGTEYMRRWKPRKVSTKGPTPIKAHLIGEAVTKVAKEVGEAKEELKVTKGKFKEPAKQIKEPTTYPAKLVTPVSTAAQKELERRKQIDKELQAERELKHRDLLAIKRASEEQEAEARIQESKDRYKAEQESEVAQVIGSEEQVKIGTPPKKETPPGYRYPYSKQIIEQTESEGKVGQKVHWIRRRKPKSD
jgi:hypothetical protein